jgi:putative adhesin
MKNSAIMKACAVLSVLLGASSVWAAVAQERDQINRSFSLPTTARVEVSAISGSVDIQAVDGETSIVQIERTARSRAELDCNNVVLEQASSNLTVRSKAVGGQGCQSIQVVYRVLLSLPRHVDVSVHGVSGPVNIGEIEGALRISGNSGSINLAQSGRGSSISGNSGTTTIKLRQLDAGGLEFSGNSGTVKLYVGDELNADVKVSGLSGSVSSELPNVQFTKTGAADYHARIGSGGPTINVEGNSGSVLLVRYRE